MIPNKYQKERLGATAADASVESLKVRTGAVADASGSQLEYLQKYGPEKTEEAVIAPVTEPVTEPVAEEVAAPAEAPTTPTVNPVSNRADQRLDGLGDRLFGSTQSRGFR